MTDLSDHLEIKVDGEDRELFMSFGLLRDLSRAFPNPADPANVFRDPNMFETCMWLLLAPRSKSGKVQVDEFDLDEHQVSSEDAIKATKWAMEHVMRFFLRRMAELPTLGEASVDQIQALLSAFPGLRDLASTSPSAGPTASSEAGSESSSSASPSAT